MLPSSNVVPVGTVSFNVILPGAVPSFLNLIVYVILSPVVTVSPAVSASFIAVICGLCTSILTSFVGSSSTTAPFTISA